MPPVTRDYYNSRSYVLSGPARELDYGTKMASLKDVFLAIRDDEEEHVTTMNECLDPSIYVKSRGSERAIFGLASLAALVAFADPDPTTLTDALADLELDESQVPFWKLVLKRIRL